MNNETEIYFHLGFSKVASTYFQRFVFPYLNDVKFYPKHQFKNYPSLNLNHFKGKVLFSSERDKRVVEVVREIVSIHPNAKIILFFRRQDDWLISRYKYGIRKHRGETFSEFFDLDNDTGLWKKDTLNYRKKIEAIEGLCKTPPLVLTYDLLKKSPDDFLDRICKYIGTNLKSTLKKNRRINTAFSDKQLIGLRSWNRFLGYQQNPYRNKFSNKVHQRFRQFLLHIIAFILRIVPAFLFKKKELLNEADKIALQQIRKYYEDDWKYCKEYELNH